MSCACQAICTLSRTDAALIMRFAKNTEVLQLSSDMNGRGGDMQEAHGGHFGRDVRKFSYSVSYKIDLLLPFLVNCKIGNLKINVLWEASATLVKIVCKICLLSRISVEAAVQDPCATRSAQGVCK